jgi:hypothetical protein
MPLHYFNKRERVRNANQLRSKRKLSGSIISERSLKKICKRNRSKMENEAEKKRRKNVKGTSLREKKYKKCFDK